MSLFNYRCVHVHEMESGELVVTSSGEEVRFQPHFKSFGQAVKLFEEFSGRHGKDFFSQDEGIDWFPAIQYFLFHKLVVPSVLYQDALCYLEDKRLKPRFSGGTRFRTFYYVRRRYSVLERIFLKLIWGLERRLIRFHNRWICRDFGEMFFQYTENEMRLKALRKEMEKHRNGVTAFGGGLLTVLKNFFHRDYFLVATTRYDPLDDYNESELLLKVARAVVSQARRQFLMYRGLFKAKNVGRRFYGIDDPLYLFPLLFALNRSGVQTIGFQHGLYSQNDFGYAVRVCKSFEWFNKLVVWDKFWADSYLRINPYYPTDSVLVGIGSEQFNGSVIQNPNNRHVLCMYERYLDVEEYVYFLKAMIRAGFYLVMKMRPQSSVSDLALEYGFTPDEMKYVSICENIDSALLNCISLIVGCKTSLLYSLLSVNRPVWVFETSYYFLEQILTLKNVRIIKKSHINQLSHLYDDSIAEYRFIPNNEFKFGKAIQDVMNLLDKNNHL